MKILQLTNKVPIPARDGGSIATFRLSIGLKRLGHEVTILAMNTKKHFIDPSLFAPIAQRQGIKLEAVNVPARISPFSALFNIFFSRLPYTAVRFKSTEFSKTLGRLLDETEFDQIWIENLYPMLYLQQIRENSKAKVIMRAHNIEHEIWERTAQHTSGLRRRYLRLLAKRIKRLENSYLNTYDYLAPITTRDAVEFEKMGNSKPCQALPTGIEVQSTIPDLRIPDSFTIAHLGALDWAPNQEGLIWFFDEVWPLVCKHYTNPEFHLAGRNAPESFIRKIKKEEINYHGEVDSASDFISHFPIHIVPLWSGSGMRIKIIEAMALGRIIVTTPIGAEGIPAKDQTDLIIRNEPKSFAQALIDLWENKKLMKEMSQNAYTFVQTNFENKTLLETFIAAM